MNCLSCEVMMPELENQLARIRQDYSQLLFIRDRLLAEREMAIKVSKMLLELLESPQGSEFNYEAAKSCLKQLEDRQKGGAK